MQFIGYVVHIGGVVEVSLALGDGRKTTVVFHLPMTPLTKKDFERFVQEQLKLIRELKERIGYLDSLVQYQTLDFDEETPNATT